MKWIVVVALYLFSLPLHAHPLSPAHCEFVNRPIDCKRLTEQECEAAKREQEIANVNRQAQCNQQLTQAIAEQTASEGGGGGQSQGGNGEAGDSTDGEAASKSGNNNTPSDTSVAAPETPNSDNVEGSKSTDNSDSQEPIPESRNQTDSRTGRSSGGPSWGTGSLCEKFKQAYERAKTDEARELIQLQAKQYKCG